MDFDGNRVFILRISLNVSLKDKSKLYVLKQSWLWEISRTVRDRKLDQTLIFSDHGYGSDSSNRD